MSNPERPDEKLIQQLADAVNRFPNAIVLALIGLTAALARNRAVNPRALARSLHRLAVGSARDNVPGRRLLLNMERHVRIAGKRRPWR